MPERIRRLRVKGWRRGDAVIVDRTSRFGNPWVVGAAEVPDRETATARFAIGLAVRRIVLDTVIDVDEALKMLKLGRYPSDEQIVRELRGKDLACPCELPEPGERDFCHAAELIRFANRGEVDA